MLYDQIWSYDFEQIEQFLLECCAEKVTEPQTDTCLDVAMSDMNDGAAQPGSSGVASASPIFRYIIHGGADSDCACMIELEAMPARFVGKLGLPNTRVRIEGPAAEAFYRKFYLRFLSGGA